MLDSSALIAAMNWMDKEVKDPKSRFYQKLDTAHVAAMGMSCGGLMSYGASGGSAHRYRRHLEQWDV